MAESRHQRRSITPKLTNVEARGVRNRAVRSAIPVLTGLLVQAATTYLVLIIAGRYLGATGFGWLTAQYLLITSIATGLFLPLEQEVARRRGDERGRDVWDDSLLPRALILALLAATAAIVVVLAVLPFSLRLLGDDPQLVAALCIALAGYACCFVSRGELAGRGQLVRYGVQLGIEGGIRLAGALVLVLAQVHGAAWFGWLFAAAPWVAFAVTAHRWSRPPLAARVDRGPPLPGAIGLLAVSGLASQLLINAGPLVVALQQPADKALVGVFLAALVIVRVPVFLFTAVQPSFLPAIAEHASADRRDSFVHLILRVVGASSALVALSMVFAVTIGPWTLSVLFGFEQNLSRWAFLEVTLSVGLFLISAVLSQSLLGRGKHGATTLGWMAGLAGLAVGTTLGHDAVARASAGFLAGATVSTVILGSLLVRAIQQWPTASKQSLRR
jgi:O-antigen/teichoic acid export membrane protein